MKTSILLFVLILFGSLNSNAKVERITLYFTGTNSIYLTSNSESELTDFNHLREVNRHIQIIEVNVYKEAGNNPDQKVVNQYYSIINDSLALIDENVTVHLYGEKRIDINFTPLNWNRADIYYNIPEFNFDQIANISNNSNDLSDDENESELTPLNTSDQQMVFVTSSANHNAFPRKMNEESFGFNIHKKVLRLKIEFIGGTADIKPGYEDHLYVILDTLRNNPTVSAHIRGHVCCGNKKSLSKRRARVVYRYLIKNGIDKDRLSYKGYGNQVPLAFPERTASDRSANRRVDVVFEYIFEGEMTYD